MDTMASSLSSAATAAAAAAATDPLLKNIHESPADVEERRQHQHHSNAIIVAVKNEKEAGNPKQETTTTKEEQACLLEDNENVNENGDNGDKEEEEVDDHDDDGDAEQPESQHDDVEEEEEEQQQQGEENEALLPQQQQQEQQAGAAVTTTIAASSEEDATVWRLTCFQRASLIILLTITWCSGIVFGCYMIGHYLLALLFLINNSNDDDGDDDDSSSSSSMMQQRWNMVLPSLYNKHRLVATTGMGVHFVGGSIVIILGAIQLLPIIRRKYPALHRWTGRVYLICSVLTAIGGLLFIWTGTGCIGGIVMDIAFSICAILTIVSSAQTYRHAAVIKLIDQHQLWAWRLYSLMISSWMYRIEYGFFTILGVPHDRQHYAYALDYIMDFFFYVPNLILVEFFWRCTRGSNRICNAKWFWNIVAVIMLILATIVLFISILEGLEIWIPGMMGKLADVSHHDDYDDDIYNLSRESKAE